MIRLIPVSVSIVAVLLLVVLGSAQPVAGGTGCTITVNSTADDGIDDTDDEVNLREALHFAAGIETPGAGEDAQLDCGMATPGLAVVDTIVFDPAVFPPENPATIQLSDSQIAMVGDVVDGTGAGVIVQGNGSFSCFFVPTSFNVIRGLHIRNCGIGIFVEGQLIVLAAPSQPQGGPAANYNLITGNIIEGNTTGISIREDTFGNVIAGNVIGTGGDAALSLNNTGVEIEGGLGNVIGPEPPLVLRSVAGLEGEGGNIIAGNTSAGVSIIEGDGTTVQGNFIGTDDTGMAAVPNGVGVRVTDSAGVLIGGAEPGEGNVISGNSDTGVLLIDGTEDTVIQGNYIGVAVDGSSPLGNGGAGVRADSTGPNVIGGDTAEEGNVIAHNGGAGVEIEATLMISTQKEISRNSIHSNGGLGIDLGADGVTLNDNQDPDAGANALQNYPLLDAAELNGGTHVQGSLNSLPSTGFFVQFFAGDECDPSDFGEGETFLGEEAVFTDGSGNVEFAVDVGAAEPGQVITATAQDPDGNTSEFSPCVDVLGGVTPTPTPSPTPTPTPTPSATPTPTPVPGILGDTDCDMDADAVDALHVLEEVAGLEPNVGCLEQGDVQCDDDLDALDALGILVYLAALPPQQQEPGCPMIGDPIV
jgi:hypothetical protein